ncbi:MAG: peptidylprolyl isomerase [Gammaproteobacteria bacterium]
MNIANDHVVTFHYRLSDADGNALEDSHAGAPLSYLHGHGGIIRGLEAALHGRAAGDSFEVTLAPAEAYGERQADAVQRVQRKYVITRGKLVPGQVVAVNTERGARQVVVIKAGRFVVDVDTNHPLAGRSLTFAVDIVDVRAATPEERAHGHAHGADGHHHH